MPGKIEAELSPDIFEVEVRAVARRLSCLMLQTPCTTHPPTVVSLPDLE